MLCYGIFMATYILFFDDGIHHNLPRFHRTDGLTKEEQKNYLQKLQQQKLAKLYSQKRGSRNRSEEDAILDQFLRKKKITRFRPKYPRMIHFLHIHKSAGTFLCKQAFHNKMAADYGKNCNVRNDQRCCWYSKEHESWTHTIDTHNETKLLEESMRFAKTAPFDFVATEKELFGPMLSDHYDYVVTLRDSRSRYKSHWQHLDRNAQQRKTDFERYRNGRKRKQPHRGGGYRVSGQRNPNQNTNTSLLQTTDKGRVGSGRSKWVDIGEDPMDDPEHWNYTLVNPEDGSVHPVGNFTKWIFGQPDNYSLRMICGSPCVNVPKYQITRKLFEHSLERIWVHFSHVLFVEDMEASFARFASAYGWDPEAKNKDEPTNSKPKNVAKKSSFQRNDHRNFSQAIFDLDPFMTALDDALYEFALRKYNAGVVPDRNSITNTSNDNDNDNSSLPQRLVWKKDYAPFQNQDLVDSYFKEGPLKNCTNPCCGYCSIW